MANEIPVVKPVIVEDSITEQAGDGITANRAKATETPDIFDNTAQAVVKQVVETVPVEDLERVEAPKSATMQQTIQGANPLVSNLENLSDGTVDIPRDGQ